MRSNLFFKTNLFIGREALEEEDNCTGIFM
jgi:hypothetical protein